MNAQTVSTTEYIFKDGYPTSETVQKVRDDADYQRAITAYRFWYPTVSVEGVFNGNHEQGIQERKEDRRREARTNDSHPVLVGRGPGHRHGWRVADRLQLSDAFAFTGKIEKVTVELKAAQTDELKSEQKSRVTAAQSPRK